MTRKKKQYEDDDGRTIASMNVDGMPWYTDSRVGMTEAAGKDGTRPEAMSKSHQRAFVWGVLKAALLVTAVFVVGYLLFILFCTHIWFV